MNVIFVEIPELKKENVIVLEMENIVKVLAVVILKMMPVVFVMELVFLLVIAIVTVMLKTVMVNAEV